jgi:hypothetical protein
MYSRKSDYTINICLPGPYSTCHEVNFIELGKDICFIPISDLKRKVLNCGYLEIGNNEFPVSVQPIESVADGFIAKYGKSHFERYFRNETEAIILGNSTPDKIGFYRILENEFDQAASDYDLRITTNPIEKYMRLRTSEILKHYCKPGYAILNIGCGTLREIEGLPENVTVTCAELSNSMIARAKKMSAVIGIQDRIDYLKTFSGVVQTGREYDIVFSSFGYLDIENIDNIAASINGNLKDSGLFIGCFWNKHGILDLLFSLLKGKFEYIRQKSNGKVFPDQSRFSTITLPKNASALRKIQGLVEIGRIGLCTLIPPYNMKRAVKLLNNLPGLFSLDSAISGLPLIRNFSDYTIIIMRKSSQS